MTRGRPSAPWAAHLDRGLEEIPAPQRALRRALRLVHVFGIAAGLAFVGVNLAAGLQMSAIICGVMMVSLGAILALELRLGAREAARRRLVVATFAVVLVSLAGITAVEWPAPTTTPYFNAVPLLAAGLYFGPRDAWRVTLGIVGLQVIAFAWAQRNVTGPALATAFYELASAALFVLFFHGVALAVRRPIREALAETERATRALEEANARLALAVRARSEFLAMMSHEIRTPLHGVLGTAQLLRRSPQSSQQRQLTDTLLASGEALRRLLDDVLDVAKVESDAVAVAEAPFAPVALVEDLLDLHVGDARDKGLSLGVVTEADVPDEVVGDQALVRQILGNLVGNALKFTPRGAVRVDVGWKDGTLSIAVSDTGEGIPASAREALFQPFQQVEGRRRSGGTGLGLYLARRLARAMGGDLALVPTTVGSRFELRLPCPGTARAPTPPEHRVAIATTDDDVRRSLEATLARAGAEVVPLDASPPPSIVLADSVAAVAEGVKRIQLVWLGDDAPTSGGVLRLPARETRVRRVLGGTASERPPPQPISTRRRRVLVVEDEPVNRFVVRGMLDRLGHEVDTAATGEEALQKARAATYDVVLMDLHLPGLDGIAATRKLLAEHPALRVIALTANAFPEDEARCREAGMSGFLAKPLRFEELDAALDRA